MVVRLSGGGNSQSGGHVIENSSGTDLTQRDILKFTGGLKATDDSSNSKTIIDDSPTRITWTEWNNLTPEQQAAIPKALITGAPGVDGPINVELIKTLWTNPSPSSEFAAQPITLSSSDYDFLLVNFAYANDNNYQSSIIAPKGHDFTIEITSPLSNGRLLNISRNVTYVSATSLTISDGTRATSYDSESSFVQNIRCIPTVIYGIKQSVTVDVSGVISDVSTSADKCMLSDGTTSVEDKFNEVLSFANTDSTSLASATTAKNVVSTTVTTPGKYLVHVSINSTTTSNSIRAYLGIALAGVSQYETVNCGMNYGFNLSDMRIITVTTANSIISATVRTSDTLNSGGASGSIFALKLT